ncbi:G patch domain-containing protein 11 [Orchesella cincta]|uniref:G patch domain-containing protein 11 n=1 Tax=Orchesella cincta TaxID=48709 RepID=A0A1D2NGD9_ORCCI|nr:G patch domain-containing protein 11 [Orchesella cincta]
MADNGSEDEEPDYMSEDFLKQCTANDIRPSLIHNRADKRKHDVIKRQVQLNQSKQEKEKERVRSMEEALKVPISDTNKGFKMLEKMGYKPGTSLGAEKIDSAKRGIKEPISIEIRQGRGGLGKEQHEREKYEETQRLGNPEEYRLRQQATAKMKEIMGDLRKAQFACRNLDEESGTLKPLEAWYWPVTKKLTEVKTVDLEGYEKESTVDDDNEAVMLAKKRRTEYVSSEEESEEEDASVDDVPNEQKLESVMDYLRSEYFYCVWCGVKYDNNTDMTNSCPGMTREDH